MWRFSARANPRQRNKFLDSGGSSDLLAQARPWGAYASLHFCRVDLVIHQRINLDAQSTHALASFVFSAIISCITKKAPIIGDEKCTGGRTCLAFFCCW
jgi:hypothetical protein